MQGPHPLRALSTPRGRDARVVVLGMALALVPALALYGFTVDDALISARYAAHVARGLGYRFNVGGEITDGVTPLGFPYLLAPFAKEGPLAALAAAKLLGLVAWVASAGFLALAVARVSAPAEAGEPFSITRARPPRRLRFAALLLLPASAPLAAWSVAGMETGLVLALAALAVALPELGAPRAGACLAGLAAALRPEMLPFALGLAAAPPANDDAPLVSRKTAVRLALAAFPFALVVAARLSIFGRPVPLSVYAKPSDVVLGARYAAACFLLTGPVALVAPWALARASRRGRALAAAVLVHLLAVAAAGGDWMPLSRLVAPALPAVVVAFAHLAVVARARATALRLALALAGELFQLIKIGPVAAKVGADRLAVIRELAPALAESKVVAALDIGWLGAATGATIVDLAGLTDPSIAVLPGGHTSKAIGRGLLDARGVDTMVLLLAEGSTLDDPWVESTFARAVEYRLAFLPGMAEAFTPLAEGSTRHLHYVVLRKKAEANQPAPSPETLR